MSGNSQTRVTLVFSVVRGGNFSIEIAVRNGPGIKAGAEHVQGELTLPEGFLEDSLQTRTRQLLFGNIEAGDASYYVLTITAFDTVEVGEYNAKLVVWGANVPRTETNVEIIVESF